MEVQPPYTFLQAILYTPHLFLLLALFVASYRVLLHPLRSVPGPFAAKITSAFGAFYVWKRCFHLASARWHEQYGPAVRVAPNRVVFNTATALHDIHNNSMVTKGEAYVQLRQNGNQKPALFNILNREEHRTKRRIIAPVISERSMRTFEPTMSKQIDSFLRKILECSHQNKPDNMSVLYERLGVDIVGQLAFGYPLNTQFDATHRVIVEGIKTRSNRSALYYFWKRLQILDPLFERFAGRDLKGFYNSLQTMIVARMAQPKDALHDFFAMASGEVYGEPGLEGTDFWAEAVFFIAAGGSTTATAMSGIFFYLSRNRSAYARLASEIRGTFTQRKEICQGPRLRSCHYLRAVIEETMRMSPSTLAPAWREQDPASIAKGEKFIVDGVFIPPGTQVAMSAYNLQHNSQYFSDPYTFRPERWLPPEAEHAEVDTEENQKVLATMKRSWAPFSMGDRSCAGKSMAYLEMSLVVAKTIWYFDFEKAPGEAGRLGEGWPGRTDGRGRIDEFQLYDSIVVGHEGPNLVFTPRGEFYRELGANHNSTR